MINDAPIYNHLGRLELTPTDRWHAPRLHDRLRLQAARRRAGRDPGSAAPPGRCAGAGGSRPPSRPADQLPSRSLARTFTASAERSPRSRIAVAASAVAATATQASEPPTLIRRAPAALISATVRFGSAEHVDRLADRLADRGDLLAAVQPGRVEDVGPRRLVGLQAGDRVVEVGVPADVVLGPGGEREREVEPARAPRPRPRPAPRRSRARRGRRRGRSPRSSRRPPPPRRRGRSRRRPSPGSRP